MSIVSNHFPEIIDEEFGRLVHPEHTRELASGIRELLSSPELAGQLGQAARAQSSHFSVAARTASLAALTKRETRLRLTTPEAPCRP